MIITDLEYLDMLTGSNHLGAGRQTISLSLSQGIVLLSLNGKELFKTTVPDDNLSDFSISTSVSKFRRLYRLGKSHGISSSALTLLKSWPGIATYTSASSSVEMFSAIS
ncbi:MAG: hypothetical protein KME07_06750 [Pegethrix bostrychoides GSE-TBD4-15B]|jgi:hypothetical protein|uniref:Uncharacterized protein n=1 Tax=Pegethrix bostrychoides GSE-TBD4-15B TaxID=2839662 RepID=A0A951PA19_9CYAN|nr:hypothetical protein [Pegethrix bostrychoides GSE-TBD4-15B]